MFSNLSALPRNNCAYLSTYLRAHLRVFVAAFVLTISTPFALGAESLADIQKIIKAGQYSQALEKVEAYIASKPKDPQGRFLKGLIFTETNRSADAITVFSKLTEDFPELPEPYNNLAVLYAQQKQYDKARTALEMAIRTHPSYTIAYENLGDIYAKLASQAYDKALQLDATNSTTQNKLALIHDLISTSPKPGVKPTATTKTAEPPKTTVAAATTNDAPVSKTPELPSTTEKQKEGRENKTAAADNTEASITTMLHSWAAAWSKKDVPAYLAYYAADFSPPKGMSRKAWEEERRQRIDKPGSIEVKLSNIRVNLSGDAATVRFYQTYRSANVNSSAGKTLTLIKTDGKWLIQQERAG